MSQLKLSTKQLKRIGFKKSTRKADEHNAARVIYSIKYRNEEIYYNPDQAEYVWYLQSNTGAAANHMHLDITTAQALFTVLSALRMPYNLMII